MNGQEAQDKLTGQRGCAGPCLKLVGNTTILITGILVAIVAGYFLLRGMGAFLITSDPLQQADAIVVLSGGGLPRIQEGVELFNDKYGQWLVLTETGQIDPDVGLNTTSISKVDTIMMGIPSGAVLITQVDADSTYKEAIAVRNLLQQKNLSTCIVVTDPYHTRRASIIFKDIVEKAGIDVSIHSVAGSWYRSDNWFLSGKGWNATLREYIKLIAYSIFYRD